MSELRAPLFRDFVRDRTDWIARGAVARDTHTGEEWQRNEPVVVVSLSPAICENIQRLMRPVQVRQALVTPEQLAVQEERLWREAEKYLPFAPLPANRVWIEEADGGGRAAIYLAVSAMWRPPEAPEHMAYLVRRADHEQVADFTIGVACRGSRFIETEHRLDDGRDRVSLAAFQLQLAIICAMLAAPGVKATDERVRDKSLRRSAVQTAPLVTYRCVDIDIDKLAGIPESMGGPTGADGRGGGVALHHVRGHLRLTEKGLVPVRPHWRGDAAWGVRLRDRNILRNEEMQ